MQHPLRTSPTSASRGDDYQGFLRVHPEPRVSRIDAPHVQFERHVAKNGRLDRTTEALDVEFVCTRGTTMKPLKAMVWSALLREYVWWQRLPSGRWEPTGSRERVQVRKLRAELSNTNEGISAEEVLDALCHEEFQRIAKEEDPNGDL